MKRCPKCGQSYADQNLNFCLNDGELLTQQEPLRDAKFGHAVEFDDPPPTLMMNDPRSTNPTGWQPSSPPAAWQGQQAAMAYNANQGLPMQNYVSPDQTLAIVSLCLGVGSLTVGWCCSTGLLLGPAALIAGIISLVQNKKDPLKYGGRPLAIGGIVTGGLFLGAYLLFIIIYGLAIIGGGIS